MEFLALLFHFTNPPRAIHSGLASPPPCAVRSSRRLSSSPPGRVSRPPPLLVAPGQGLLQGSEAVGPPPRAFLCRPPPVLVAAGRGHCPCRRRPRAPSGIEALAPSLAEPPPGAQGRGGHFVGGRISLGAGAGVPPGPRRRLTRSIRAHGSGGHFPGVLACLAGGPASGGALGPGPAWSLRDGSGAIASVTFPFNSIYRGQRATDSGIHLVLTGK